MNKAGEEVDLRPYAGPEEIRRQTDPLRMVSGPAAYVSYPSYPSIANRTRCAPVGRG